MGETLQYARTFDEGECYNLHYDPYDLPTTPCSIAVECASTVYEDDMDSCPGSYSFNVTAILADSISGVRTVINPNGQCSSTRGFETIEYEFTECYKSTFYQNCYFQVELGEVKYDYLDDDDSSSSILTISSLYFLLSLLVLLFA